jgi:hypothetical protein
MANSVYEAALADRDPFWPGSGPSSVADRSRDGTASFPRRAIGFGSSRERDACSRFQPARFDRDNPRQFCNDR